MNSAREDYQAAAAPLPKRKLGWPLLAYLGIGVVMAALLTAVMAWLER